MLIDCMILTNQCRLYLRFVLTIGFIAIAFFNSKLLKPLISIECKYNKLQFGLRITFIEVSKQKLRITTSLYVYNKTYSKEIHLGVIPFSKVKVHRVVSEKHSSLAFLKEGLPETAKAWKRPFMTSCHCSPFF